MYRYGEKIKQDMEPPKKGRVVTFFIKILDYLSFWHQRSKVTREFERTNFNASKSNGLEKKSSKPAALQLARVYNS